MAQEQTKLDDAARSRAALADKDLHLQYPENDQKGVLPQYASDLAAVETLHLRTVGARTIDFDPVHTKFRHDEAGRVFEGNHPEAARRDMDWAEASMRLRDDGIHRPLDADEYKQLARGVEDIYKGSSVDPNAPDMSPADREALTELHEPNKTKMVEVAADAGRLHDTYQEPPFEQAELRTTYLESHQKDLDTRAQVARQYEELDRFKLAKLEATASVADRAQLIRTVQGSKDGLKEAETQAMLAARAAEAERLSEAEREAFRKENGLDAERDRPIDVAKNLHQAQREADAEEMRDELGLPADYGKKPVDIGAAMERVDQRTLELSNAAAARFKEFMAKRASYESTQETPELREGHEINRVITYARAQEDRLSKGEITPQQLENNADAQQGRDYSEALDRVRTQAIENDAQAGAIEPSKAEPEQSSAHADNEIEDFEAGANAQARGRAIPDTVSKQFPTRSKGNVHTHYYQHDPERVAFVDKGDKLQTPRNFDQQGVRAMVDVADARGWDEIKVHGAESFRRQVYIEAARRGIEVKGYKPTEAERQVSDAASAKHERNQAAADAFASAADRKAKTEAAKEHPELAKAYAIEAAAAKFAKQAGWSVSAQQRFQERVHDSVERDIREGKKLEQIEVRHHKADRHRETDAVRER